MYTRAVWKEGEQEEEGVVPENWIDRNNRTVRWPHSMSATKTERALRDKINPQDHWMTFPLIKIKFSSASHRECDNYNLTSQAEDDDDDEVPFKLTRNRTKKGTPEGFVRNELTDSDNENIRGVKLPKYPTAPKKLWSIQASEDEARSVERADSSQGSEMSTPCPQTASTAPRCGDLSTPRSRHAAGGCPMDGYRSRSRGRSSRGYRHRSRSRHSGSRNTDRSRSQHGGSRHTDRSRSRHGGSRNTDRSRSQHGGSRHTDRSRSRPGGSRHTDRSRSRHGGSRHTDRSRSRHGGSRHTDRSRSRHSGSRHTDRHDRSQRTDAYRCDERSWHSDLTSPPYDGPRHDAATDLKWTFPLPTDVFQKKVLTLLFDLRDQYKKAEPASSAVYILRMETMVDFEAEEQRLCDAQAFDTLVLQIARIGGKNTKDCVHKVLDRLFSNALMARFNVKGKGKRGKKPLENTKVYRAIQDGVMKFDPAATEGFIRMCASEHLKHAPQRCGGRVDTLISQLSSIMTD